ncbi:MAG TPA: cobyrinate a,c-diamide synthase [Candidatus Dormibacteraeota bacterium]|jgi:cobyrinic acid a,c-diamide synthase|nr:cobyrinate a,c-diamide synthase [Candidatus Dormibacteraeota bacterium]
MLDEVRTPRLVIAGTASNVGKTVLTAGLIAAFKARGISVQSFKVGPDYIDPAYLAHVSGRPCRNLDSWMLGEGAIRQVLAQGALGADLALVEGMMGLFDGRGDSRGGSTAEVARIIKAPVVLVMDVGNMGETAAAVALGFKNYSDSPKIAGVLLNNVGSDGHRRSVEDAIWETAKLPVLGALRRMPELDIPQRQLGLLPVTENKEWDRTIGVLAETMDRDVDLDLLLRIARKAELLPLVPKKVFQGTPSSEPPIKLAVAYDEAFNFYYPENLELLEEHGAEVVPFSPLEDGHLPSGAAGLYLGGGFPEVFVEPLASNRAMAESIARAYRSGMPIYAECGGLMYLGRSLRTDTGKTYDMAGVIPVDVEMDGQIHRFGYRQLLTLEDSILSPKGQFYRGHEFHWSRIVGQNGGLKPAYQMQNAEGEVIGYEGVIAPNLLASYVHLHFGQNPLLVDKFVQHCREYALAHASR